MRRTVEERVTALTVAPSGGVIKPSVCSYKTGRAAWHRVLGAAVQTVTQDAYEKAIYPFGALLMSIPLTCHRYLHKQWKNMSVFLFIRLFCFFLKQKLFFNSGVLMTVGPLYPRRRIHRTNIFRIRIKQLWAALCNFNIWLGSPV